MFGYPLVQAACNQLLSDARSEASLACLLAAARKESGAWLNAIPVISLGLWMKDNIFKIALGLMIGAPLVHPHACCHCGDIKATHDLSECGGQEKFGICKDPHLDSNPSDGISLSHGSIVDL